jgi:hypothetical protein
VDFLTRQLLRRAIDAKTREQLPPIRNPCVGCGGSILEGCATIDCPTCMERLYRRGRRAVQDREAA